MTNNRFGKIFSFTSWGESHGTAIGCVIDGVPSNIPIEIDYIQARLDRRRPGQSSFTTQRNEADQVSLLSGIFENDDNIMVTTGTPISAIIYNQDSRSKDYGDIAQKYRPCHGDITYDKKYGIRDYRGGGRTSARETANRVIAGAIAEQILHIIMPNLSITGYISQIGTQEVKFESEEYIDSNPLFLPVKDISKFESYLKTIRKDGNSVGAEITAIIKNLPIGIGEPIYNKLSSQIANGLMSINAVKGVEIGIGMKASQSLGSEIADEIFYDSKTQSIKYSSNFSGGMLAGISNGDNLEIRCAFKPTSSILHSKHTIDKYNNNTEILTKGRHDPCVGIRAVPVVEAMLYCIILDMVLMNKALHSFK